jgi:hypothetical protein
MGILPVNKVLWSFLLLCAAACILQPVMAENGTITIAYRGSGGSYIGETIIFDGRNTYGNTTLLKITGPGLPSEGVPVNNLNGVSGSATPVGVDQNGMWKFAWYASGISGLEKLQTARYTFTATDSANPDASATTSLMLKKPEFYVNISPNPSNPGNYVEVTGTAEQGITSAKIDITDPSGKVLHTFTSPVSSSGYLSFGFHSDMEPGQYTVTISNPSLKIPYVTVLSVVAPEGALPFTPVRTPEQGPAVSTADVTDTAASAPGSKPGPTKSPVPCTTILAALIIGAIVPVVSRRS